MARPQASQHSTPTETKVDLTHPDRDTAPNTPEAPSENSTAGKGSIPPAPPRTPEAGHKTPAYQEWLRQYHPNDPRIID